MRTILLLSCCVYVICAAEGATNFDLPRAGTPAVPPAAPPAVVRPSPTLPRPVQAYEVETLVVTPNDPSGLATWAELAAHGFHLVAVLPQDGKQVLFLERMRNPGSSDMRLPSVVAADGGLAQAVQAKLLQIIGERQQAVMAGRPPALPQPSKENK